MEHIAVPLRSFVTFYEFLGHCSLRSRFLLGLVINVIALCLLVVFYSRYQVQVQKYEFMEHFNDNVHLIATYLCILTVLIETVHKRRHYSEFFQLSVKLESYYKELNVNVERYISKSAKEYTIHFFLLLVATITIEVLIILNIGIDQQWVLYWSVDILPLLLNRFRLLQISFFLRIPSVHLRILEDVLQRFLRVTKHCPVSLRDDLFYKGSNRRLKYLKEAYLLVIKEMDTFNRIFNYSLCGLLLQNFIELLSGSYWLYYYQLDDHCVFGRDSITSPYSINNN